MIDFLKQMAKSKTIIVNSLTVIVGTLGFLAGHDVIAANPELAAGLLSAVGVLNVILRLVTSLPISGK